MYSNFEDIIAASKSCEERYSVSIAAAADEKTMHLVKELVDRQLCGLTLVDDADKLELEANRCGVNLAKVTVIDEKDPAKIGLTAVREVSSGRADVFVKGKMNTSDFLRAVLDREVGLRTSRTLSALTCYDIPSERKLLFMTDGGIIISPTLTEKADILRNAVETLHRMGIAMPKIALLSANERVSYKMPSSVDAAELCAMAARGELPAGIYEGPIALDVALRPDAAKVKGIESRISGDVDLLLVPNIETGNCLGKAMGYFGKGQTAGLVVGASRPVVMSSRAASVNSKLTAVAWALLACQE